MGAQVRGRERHLVAVSMMGWMDQWGGRGLFSKSACVSISELLVRISVCE